jgi:hypothetical protein
VDTNHLNFPSPSQVELFAPTLNEDKFEPLCNIKNDGDSEDVSDILAQAISQANDFLVSSRINLGISKISCNSTNHVTVLLPRC